MEEPIDQKLKRLRRDLKILRENAKTDRKASTARKSRFISAAKGDPSKLTKEDTKETVDGETILPFICKKIIGPNEWRPKTIKRLTVTVIKTIQRTKLKPDPMAKDSEGIPLIHLMGERGVDLFQIFGKDTVLKHLTTTDKQGRNLLKMFVDWKRTKDVPQELTSAKDWLVTGWPDRWTSAFHESLCNGEIKFIDASKWKSLELEEWEHIRTLRNITHGDPIWPYPKSVRAWLESYKKKHPELDWGSFEKANK